jgi:steroid delta-isomerase
MPVRVLVGVMGCVGLLSGWTAARAEPPEAAVRAALETWTADFNAGRADAACALFAPDLRYDFRGFPERGYQAICDLLHRSLADRTRRYTYALDIRETLVAGDLAVVRLVWTLTVARAAGAAGAGEDGAAEAVSREPGMDVFRRQPDGAWRIIRYIAYEAP